MKNTWIRMMKNESIIDYRYNLFCLPYAGGGTSIFYQWQSMLKNAGILVCPILLPGREHRINEELIDNAYELSNQIYKGIQEELNRPFLIFGHSMGGIIAYELSRLIYEKEKKCRKFCSFPAQNYRSIQTRIHTICRMTKSS